ncbi:MAG: methyltransferase domain-containing protein [Clostridia bacterium]|nr:methyltransferase domain-containing protein [Clostridia bacterium]
MKKLTRKEIVRELEKPNGSAELAADERIDRIALADEAAAMFIEEGIGSALLVRLAKSRALLLRMSGNPALMEKIRSAVSDESPKIRRNSARLLGSLSRDAKDARLLIDRLSAEETRFVRPSLLLALGSVGGEEAEAVLDAYTPAAPADETEKKHYEEECEALKLARAAVMKHEKHSFAGLDREYEIELAAPDRLTAQLESELRQLGLEPYDIRRSSLKVKTKDYPALFAARCFHEALFPIASVNEPTAENIAAAAKPFMTAFMPAVHAGEPPFRYRIEIEGELPGERTAFKKTLRDLLDDGMLVNAPSDYELELRICAAPGGTRLYLKLLTVKDDRFLYRKETIPASMNPATAAAVLRFAGDHLKVNARVIDPCCGSGTLLFERGLLSPCDSLTGVDIAHKAIDAARTNAEAAVRHYGMRQAKFICNDILRFEVKRPYDELICNLPFGNRVGSHSSCEKLYAGLLDKLPTLVKKGGIALLYTMEFTLLKKLIRERPGLEILSQGRTEAGGLTPMIFMIRVGKA